MKKSKGNNSFIRSKKTRVMFLLFCVMILSLTIGYSSINEEIKISSEASFKIEEIIRVENISLYETTNLAEEQYIPSNGKDIVNVGVDLKKIDSEISYKVEISNLGTVAMWIDSIEQETNNNSNVGYFFSDSDIKTIINPGEIKEFYLTIKYNDNITSLPSVTTADMKLKFNFFKPESHLVDAIDSDDTATFLNGNIPKNKIEEITFLPTVKPVENYIGYWDASSTSNKTVIASYIDDDNDNMYELYIGGVGEVIAPENSNYLFSNFINAKSINFDSYFNTDNTYNMDYMFNNCESLIELDLSDFNTNNLKGILRMFFNCNKLTSLNIDNFNTSQIVSMQQLFSGCASLKSLDLSSFSTEEVTNMQQMFSDCTSLTTLDLSFFDTTNVTDISGMFNDCGSLTELNLSSFTSNNIENIDYIFSGCNKLQELDVRNFDFTRITEMVSAFDFNNEDEDTTIYVNEISKSFVQSQNSNFNVIVPDEL